MFTLSRAVRRVAGTERLDPVVRKDGLDGSTLFCVCEAKHQADRDRIENIRCTLIASFHCIRGIALWHSCNRDVPVCSKYSRLF